MPEDVPANGQWHSLQHSKTGISTDIFKSSLIPSTTIVRRPHEAIWFTSSFALSGSFPNRSMAAYLQLCLHGQRVYRPIFGEGIKKLQSAIPPFQISKFGIGRTLLSSCICCDCHQILTISPVSICMRLGGVDDQMGMLYGSDQWLIPIPDFQTQGRKWQRS